MESEDEDEDSDHEALCAKCEKDGELLCCDTCTKVFHLDCLDPPLEQVPDGKWSCPYCVLAKEITSKKAPKKRAPESKPINPSTPTKKKKKASDSEEFEEELIAEDSVHESSEEEADGEEVIIEYDKNLKFPVMPRSAYQDQLVEKIFISKSHPTKSTKMYLVKWEEFSYRKCVWIDQKLLGDIATQKLRNFDRGSKISDIPKDSIKPSYLEVHRILAQKGKGTNVQYYVLWKNLEYDGCTWENESELTKEELEAYHTQTDINEALRHMEAIKQIPTNEALRFKKQPKFFTGGTLKSYQLQGVNWMLNAYHQKTNVMLADEMGLGKTVQSITFLASLYHYRTRGPFLVVAPVSTLRNWEREFARWVPGLYVVKYTGNQDARKIIRANEFQFLNKDSVKNSKKTTNEKQPTKFHVLLTSYNMICQDDSFLKRPFWEVLVVDEAQRLKNSASKLSQVLSGFRTGYKLLLTGTPLQNNLQELYVLLNFLNPEQFTKEQDLSSQFGDGDSITKEQQVTQLHKLLAPHMLRRVKADVLDGLPAKAEFIVRVEMSDMQIQFYKAILTRNYEILHQAASDYKSNARVSLLNIMTELQKCCNHPYLFPGAEPETSNPDEAFNLLVSSSGKLQLLDKMLDKLKALGHRVLIFSQMTRLLDILEDYLFYKNFSYERIDGSVTGNERQERIDRFNAKDSVHFCFLLSTRAGGLGINLTTADTVIIYDSDWNPHNDIQAFSRAHRIGQEKQVMIYRMVTRASVEESLIQRAKKKMMLEYLVVEKMGSKGETKLKKGELDEILRFGSEDLFKQDGARQGISYDDEAIDKLLDRSDIAQIAREQSQNEYLNSFKVAEYNDAVEMDDDKDDFWSDLLSAPFEASKSSQKQKTLGKGKRVRQNINYSTNQVILETDADVEDWQVVDQSSSDDEDKSKRRTRDRRNLDENFTAPLVEGEGKEMKIMGFLPNHRAAFMKMVMRFGLCEIPWWLDNNRNLGFLRAKSPEQLEEYNRMFLDHLLEPDTGNDIHSDGCPRNRSMPVKEILSRLICMSLIRKKIASCSVVEDFDINDENWTELRSSWTEKWGKQQDFLFLQGVARHGQGKWVDIISDPEFDLYRAAADALGRKAPAQASMPQLSSGSAPTYKPDKIVSRFLRKRLQLIESALFIEYQLQDEAQKLYTGKPTAAESAPVEEPPKSDANNDSSMDDTPVIKSDPEAESAPGNTSGDPMEVDSNTSDEKELPAKLQSPTPTPAPEQTSPAAPVPVSNVPVVSPNAPDTEESTFVLENFKGKLTEELYNYLQVPSESTDDQNIKLEYHSKLEFLESFGEMYNLVHHLRDQLKAYSELMHPRALEAAQATHHRGLTKLDSLICDAKFKLSKVPV